MLPENSADIKRIKIHAKRLQSAKQKKDSFDSQIAELEERLKALKAKSLAARKTLSTERMLYIGKCISATGFPLKDPSAVVGLIVSYLDGLKKDGKELDVEKFKKIGYDFLSKNDLLADNSAASSDDASADDVDDVDDESDIEEDAESGTLTDGDDADV